MCVCVWSLFFTVNKQWWYTVVRVPPYTDPLEREQGPETKEEEENTHAHIHNRVLEDIRVKLPIAFGCLGCLLNTQHPSPEFVCISFLSVCAPRPDR